VVEEGLIGFPHRSVRGGIVEEGVAKVFMKGFALLVIPLVHRIKIRLRRVGGGVSRVGVRTKCRILNN
jgi:hypothetical protein